MSNAKTSIIYLYVPALSMVSASNNIYYGKIDSPNSSHQLD